MSDEKVKPQKPLLADHLRIKKRFIPPFFAAFKDYDQTSSHDAKWLERIVPEIVWIALLNESLGFKLGADVSLACAKAATEISKDQEDRIFFGPCSAYAKLTQTQKLELTNALGDQDILETVRDSLYPLFRFYPTFPMSFLYEGSGIMVADPEAKKSILKKVIAETTKRGGVPATFTQANLIYIAFITEFLVTTPDISLAKFPEIRHYPNTDLSKQVASSVRSSVSGFFAALSYADNEWPKQFWLRGMELEPCQEYKFNDE